MPFAFLILLALLVLLISLTIKDIRTRTLPNNQVALLAVLGLIHNLLVTFSLGADVLSTVVGLIISALAIMSLTLALVLLPLRAFRCGEPPLGGGDIKLLGSIGLTVGYAVVPIVLFSCLAAIVVNLLLRRATFAFGPYLAVCTAIVLLAQWL